jgi:hypothetical protein
MNLTIASKKFHGHTDSEVLYQKRVLVGETTETKHITITERDLSYRAYTHFHPYVGRLVQRLLQKSTAGLQAADTDYEPLGASLPQSVEVALPAATALSVPVGARIGLVTDLQTTIGGAPATLAAGMQFKVSAAAQATFPSGTGLTLVEGMTATPSPGTVLPLATGQAATLGRDTTVTLTGPLQILRYDGSPTTVPAGAQVILLGRTALTLPAATSVRLMRSKRRPKFYEQIFTTDRYAPTDIVRRPYPVKDLDFSTSGAYSVYNWELFFHVPFTIATHLSKNQRFAEAQRWFHFLFDPTDDSDGPTPERFWKVRPFQSTDVRKIEEIMVNLATGADEDLKRETVRSIEAWRDSPFRPHLVARYRQQAYMYKTVMAYLDNLIDWGDSLFRQDTGEAIDEALMLYVLAANILGPRPIAVPRKGTIRPQTYANLRGDLDKFGNALRAMEADIPFDLLPFPAEPSGNGNQMAPIASLGKALYFGIPRNDKLLGYWDTVADRLFKIRNSLNIQGVFRQLALFEPPIDPAMLARAAAAGLDIGAIVSGLNQPLPLVRFQLLAQKASEICQEVKSLGNNLLSAMEKEDGEAMAILRAKHERVVMEMVEQVKYGQLQEAIKSREGLLQSLALAEHRFTYYQTLLGAKKENLVLPQLDELDKSALAKFKLNVKEPALELPDIPIDITTEVGDEGGGKKLNTEEGKELTKLKEARQKQEAAAVLDKIAGVVAILPNFGGHIQPFGPGMSITFGGQNISAALNFAASFDRSSADNLSYQAGNMARIGGYSRREQDWSLQSSLAAGEINQLMKQLRAAQLREAIAEQELKSHRQQMKHAEEIEHFLNAEGTEKNGKKTNKALYAWMKREVKGLYGQCFQFAFDVARKAERALQHELGNTGLSYLQFGYLAGKEGLLAGEKLYLDIKRMDMAYHELNQREYELTKHVSLMQLDPLALLQLRTTGRCRIILPETLFEMDGPGHYFRRIKSVAVSIPCVTGPYAGVNCTLTLLKSSVRTSPVLRGGAYARENAEDDRFSDYFGSLQSIVTSSAQNDTGLFETNLRDERYLPFEHSGAISEWMLELPANPSKEDPRQFDYDTISDVILHLRYTARQGGGLLRKTAVEELKTSIAQAAAAGSVRLFSVRHDFPNEWARFRNQKPAAGQRFELSLKLRPEHYPFWSRGKLKSVKDVEVVARSGESSVTVFDKVNDQGGAAASASLSKDAAYGKLLFAGTPPKTAFPAKPDAEMKLYFGHNKLEDLWIAITWSSEE